MKIFLLAAAALSLIAPSIAAAQPGDHGQNHGLGQAQIVLEFFHLGQRRSANALNVK